MLVKIEFQWLKWINKAAKNTSEIISCFWLARLVFGTGFGSKKSKRKSSICANQHPFKKPLAHKNSDSSSALEKKTTCIPGQDSSRFHPG